MGTLLASDTFVPDPHVLWYFSLLCSYNSTLVGYTPRFTSQLLAQKPECTIASKSGTLLRLK